MAVTTAVALVVALGAAQTPAPPQRSITQLRDRLYLARNNNHDTVFLVTPQGIVLGDPISSDFSRWLKGELASRFPNRAVRVVVHSHHHWDHASGAEVWTDTAEVIGHENFGAELKKSAALRPEVYTAVRLPESTFRDRRRITLGGETVDVIHPGPTHSLDAAVLYFPRLRAMFAVDFIPPKQRFAGSFAYSAPLSQWIAAVRAVEALDFDMAIAGHGDPGVKADVTAYRGYLEDLLKVVSDGIAGNLSVEQLQASGALDRYKGWANFPQGKNQNIAEAYAQLRAQRP